MTSHELANLLLSIPDCEVIMQKDAEGNGYSPLAGADPNALYVSHTTWHGDVYSLDWTAEDCCMEEEEWAEMKSNYPQVIVLYPVN